MSCIANQIGDTKNNGKGKDKNEQGLVGAPSGAMISASTSEDLGTLVGTILFAYDEAGHLIGEYDELGNRIREYIWLGDQPVAMVQDDGVYYIHSDHLNTPKVVTDVNQQIVWKGDYKPFGEVEKTVSTVKMNLRFPGQYHDIETGLNYNYFRTYDSATGRYTQSDPIGIYGGLNMYAYLDGQPINASDPLGLYKLKGFPVGDDAAMRVAIEQAKIELRKCARGECDPQRELRASEIEDIIERIDSATYVYSPFTGHRLCGRVPGGIDNALRMLFGGGKIEITPTALHDSAACCSIESVIAHEAAHLAGSEESQARFIQEECFNCPPGKGYKHR